MNPRRLSLALFAAFMLSAYCTYGQGSAGALPKRARTPADYAPRTLAEIAAAGSQLMSTSDKEGTTYVHGDLFPSKVTMIYKGSARPVSGSKKDLINQWAQRYAGAPTHYTARYQTDVLFVQDGMSYWFTAGSETVRRFKQEMKKGGKVDLYVIRLGALKNGDKWEWVLLVENFEKPKMR
jgi:hypothetical protein